MRVANAKAKGQREFVSKSFGGRVSSAWMWLRSYDAATYARVLVGGFLARPTPECLSVK